MFTRSCGGACSNGMAGGAKSAEHAPDSRSTTSGSAVVAVAIAIATSLRFVPIATWQFTGDRKRRSLRFVPISRARSNHRLRLQTGTDESCGQLRSLPQSTERADQARPARRRSRTRRNLQALQEPVARSRTGTRSCRADPLEQQVARVLLGDDLRRFPYGRLTDRRESR